MKTRWLLAALWIVTLPAFADATTLARMNLRGLTAAAAVIARARCLTNASGWQAGEIWTLTQFETLETFKGALPSQFTVRLIGGEVGGIESIVSDVPRFRPGEEVVLFLEPSAEGSYSVTAWTEGTFRVHRDRSGHAFVTQGSAGEAVYDRAARQFHIVGIHGMPLGEFRQQLRDLIRGSTSRQQHAVGPGGNPGR